MFGWGRGPPLACVYLPDLVFRGGGGAWPQTKPFPSTRYKAASMPTSYQRARYEATLGRVSKALFYASQAAEHIGEAGAQEDLARIRREVTAMLETSLRNRRWPTARERDNVPF